MLIFVLYGLLLVASADDICEQMYKCFPSGDPSTYQISGEMLTCRTGYLCNVLYNIPCTPCVPKKTVCDSVFTCTSSTQVLLKGPNFQVDCPTSYICNSMCTSPYTPCVRTTCSTPNFVCLSTQSGVSNGVVFTCASGYACNRDNAYPCTQCILTGSATTTSTTTQSPTPTCNDGHGSDRPCRPGPSGANYYYKCKPVWYWYEYETVPCTNLGTDNCPNGSGVCTALM